jgi:hypothetical protein
MAAGGSAGAARSRNQRRKLLEHDCSGNRPTTHWRGSGSKTRASRKHSNITFSPLFFLSEDDGEPSRVRVRVRIRVRVRGRVRVRVRVRVRGRCG